jgi:UDPglucose 6-dehydrogenase
MEIAKATARVNEQVRLRMVEKIGGALGGLKGKTVAMLGLSFKPNTNDLRESPAVAIAEKLMAEGCAVRVYDPAALEEGMKMLPKLTPCSDPYETARGADALVLLTEWNEFRNLDLKKLKSSLREPRFIDLRNVYEPERMVAAGFHYHSIGRPDRRPPS